MMKTWYAGLGASMTWIFFVFFCAFAWAKSSWLIMSIWPPSSAFRRAELSSIEMSSHSSTYGLPFSQ